MNRTKPTPEIKLLREMLASFSALGWGGPMARIGARNLYERYRKRLMRLERKRK